MDDWDFVDVDNPAFACSVSDYVLVCNPRMSAGGSPRGDGVSCSTRVLLTLSSGPISVSGDPQSPPSRGNDISMPSDEPRTLVVVSQGVEKRGHLIKRISRTASDMTSDLSLSYQPNLIWETFSGWQYGYDKAVMASFCPISFAILSPDTSAASSACLSDANAFLLAI